MKSVAAEASPNLGLVKYWGKASVEENLADTTSIGVTLRGLRSEVTVAFRREGDQIVVDDKLQDPRRFAPFLDALRTRGGTPRSFSVVGRNSFPGAAGLASSASGFAAAAKAGLRLLGLDDGPEAVSSLARIGSASAARAAFGGICKLERLTEAAEPLFDEGWWPELRILIAVVSTQHKPLSSREAMNRCRESSPYYRSWVETAPEIAEAATRAIAGRDIDALGEAMQKSYLGMFTTMFTSVPPIIYWLPESIALIHRCRELRERGIPAWETMDAGPQVKILTVADHLEAVRRGIEELGVTQAILESAPGAAPRLLREE